MWRPATLLAKCSHLSSSVKFLNLSPSPHLLKTTATLSSSRHEFPYSPSFLPYSRPHNIRAVSYLHKIQLIKDKSDFIYGKSQRRTPRPQRELVEAIKRPSAFVERGSPPPPPEPRLALPLPKELDNVKHSTAKTRTTNIPSIPQSALSYHYETTPPSRAQLRAANRFFLSHPATPLFSALKFFTQPLTGIPEVCFLGRSNAGKSSLLNSLTGQKALCQVSFQPGRTRHMAGYGVGGVQSDGRKGKLVVMDMPGYGKGSRPEWGKEILKYLVQRKELRRVFVIINAAVGLKQSDMEMLALLRQYGISHQILLGKVDQILLGLRRSRAKKQAPGISKEQHEAAVRTLRKKVNEIMAVVQPEGGGGPGALGEILCVASEGGEGIWGNNAGLGLDALRWAILQATGLNWNGEVLEAEEVLEREDGSGKQERESELAVKLDERDADHVESEEDENEESTDDDDGDSNDGIRVLEYINSHGMSKGDAIGTTSWKAPRQSKPSASPTAIANQRRHDLIEGYSRHWRLQPAGPLLKPPKPPKPPKPEIAWPPTPDPWKEGREEAEAAAMQKYKISRERMKKVEAKRRKMLDEEEEKKLRMQDTFERVRAEVRAEKERRDGIKSPGPPKLHPWRKLRFQSTT